MDIATLGPAEVAGLKVGDVITAIAGVSTTTSDLSDTRRSLKLLPLDRAVAVSYSRGGETATAMLHARDLVPN